MPQIEQFRDVLRERRRALLHQVRHLQADLRRLDTSIPPEFEEEAQEENISRVLAGLGERERAEIAAVDRALVRIEEGDYGRCEECAELIPLERLEAVPTATTCITCAEARERTSASTGGTGRAPARPASS